MNYTAIGTYTIPSKKEPTSQQFIWTLNADDREAAIHQIVQPFFDAGFNEFRVLQLIALLEGTHQIEFASSGLELQVGKVLTWPGIDRRDLETDGHPLVNHPYKP